MESYIYILNLQISNVTLHPGYMKSNRSDFDIAVVKLKNSINKPSIQTVNLPVNTNAYFAAATVSFNFIIYNFVLIMIQLLSKFGIMYQTFFSFCTLLIYHVTCDRF